MAGSAKMAAKWKRIPTRSGSRSAKHLTSCLQRYPSFCDRDACDLGLPVASKSHFAIGRAESGYGREWHWKVQLVPSPASARRCRAQYRRRVARERRWIAFHLMGGPEEIGRRVRQGEYPVQGTVRKKPVSLKLGFASQTFGYCIDLGYPPPPPPSTLFSLDPAIKRECIWHGDIYRRAAILVDRRDGLVLVPSGADEELTILTRNLSSTDSMLATVADPQRAPEMLAVRESIRSWRFYEGFRTDISSPVRIPQIGTFTPVLSSEGTDLPAALETILEIGDREALEHTIDDAFPGSEIEIEARTGQFEVRFHQHGLLRPLSAAELSDGTLRFLLWSAALLTPRPPELMVLNEPETSLHPDLLPALSRLISFASGRTQVVVVSHSLPLIEALEKTPNCRRIHLEKS